MNVFVEVKLLTSVRRRETYERYGSLHADCVRLCCVDDECLRFWRCRRTENHKFWRGFIAPPFHPTRYSCWFLRRSTHFRDWPHTSIAQVLRQRGFCASQVRLCSEFRLEQRL